MRLLASTCLSLIVLTSELGTAHAPTARDLDPGGTTAVAKTLVAPRWLPEFHLATLTPESWRERAAETTESTGERVENQDSLANIIKGRLVSRKDVCDTLIEAAEANGLPAPFLIRLIQQESGFKSDAVSRAGAQGMAQFMPKVAAERGLANPFDPLQALHAAAHLLRELFHEFGNLGLAAAAYNAGPNRIKNWLAKGGKLPDETRSYVQIITGKTAERWRGKEKLASEQTVPARVPCRQEAGAPIGPQHPPIKTSVKKEDPKHKRAVAMQLSAQKQPKKKQLANSKTKPAKGKPVQVASARERK